MSSGAAILARSGLRPFWLRRALLTAGLVAVALYSLALFIVRLAQSYYIAGLGALVGALFWTYMTSVLLIRPFSSVRIVTCAVGAWIAVSGLLRLVYGAQHTHSSILAAGGVLLGLGVLLTVLGVQQTPARSRLSRPLREQVERLPTAPRPGSRIASLTTSDGRHIENVVVRGGGYVRSAMGASVDVQNVIEVAPGETSKTATVVEAAGLGSSGALITIAREPSFAAQLAPLHVLLDGAELARRIQGVRAISQ